MACVTGNGTTLTMTPSLTATLVDLGDIGQSIPMIDDNDLASGSLDKKCVGDLVTQDDFTFVVKYEDSTVGDLDTHTVGVSITSLTVTPAAGGSDTLTLASANISARTITGIANNTRVLVSYTLTPTSAWVYNIDP